MPFNSEEAKIAGQKSKRGVSAKTKQWEMLGDEITGNLTDRINLYLNSLNGKELFDAYCNLLEYFKPKFSRYEHTGKDEEAIIINIVHPDKNLMERI